MVGARDRPRARQGRVGRHGPPGREGRARLQPVGVLHRGGARRDAVQRPRALLRRPGRGGVPRPPSRSTRCATRSSSTASTPRCSSATAPSRPPRAGARRRQRGVHRALRRAPRPRAGEPARQPRATSRRRSTSSCSTTWSSRARSRSPASTSCSPISRTRASCTACSRATSASRRTSIATSPTAPGTSSSRPPDSGAPAPHPGEAPELMPIATGVLVPPGVEDPYDYEILGYHSSETHRFAFTALARRLKVIGVPSAPRSR